MTKKCCVRGCTATWEMTHMNSRKVRCERHSHMRNQRRAIRNSGFKPAKMDYEHMIRCREIEINNDGRPAYSTSILCTDGHHRLVVSPSELNFGHQ